MLTQINSEFWVIMSEKTPPFPTTNRLPLLIENSQTENIEFKITNPYDPEVKVFDTAAAAQFNIDVFKEACKRQGHEVNFGIYPFKVECQVRIASVAEMNGWSNNMPPIDHKLSIPKPKPLGPGMTWDELKRTLPSFKKIRIKHIDKDDAVKTLNVDVSQFVPWVLKNETLKDWPWKEKIKHMVFLGSECRFNEDLSSERLIPSSVIVEEPEYQRLLKVYKKFQQNPSDFIVKGDDT